jgi:hypothetical protein
MHRPLESRSPSAEVVEDDVAGMRITWPYRLRATVGEGNGDVRATVRAGKRTERIEDARAEASAQDTSNTRGERLEILEHRVDIGRAPRVRVQGTKPPANPIGGNVSGATGSGDSSLMPKGIQAGQNADPDPVV